MKLTEAILAACMAMSLAGCALRGAPKTAHTTPPAPNPVVTQAVPPPPPAPLSIPQTNVDLPKSQPLDPEALVTLPPPPEPPAETSTATRSPRRPPGAVPTAPPRTETPPPAVVTVPQPEQERPPHERLSDREYRVMWLLASGKTLHQIAEEMRLSPSTVFNAKEPASLEDWVKKGFKENTELLAKVEKEAGKADKAKLEDKLKNVDQKLKTRAQVLAKELQNGK